MKKVMIFALAFATTEMPASAQSDMPMSYIDGHKLHQLCVNPAKPYDYPICVGYVVGVVDRLEFSRGTDGKASCLPDNVKLLTLVDLVKGYMQRHPEDRRYPAAAVVQFSLVEAFRLCGN